MHFSSCDLPENIYGHRKRLSWICSHLSRGHPVVDVGCGTGYMVTRPLALMGYDVVGVDVHEESILLGQDLFLREGLDPGRLRVGTIDQVSGPASAVIVSEVLEHLEQGAIDELLAAARRKLVPGGLLLVTVPRGRGWFEWESFLWFRLGLGRWINATKLPGVWQATKHRVFGRDAFEALPSSLDTSPHCQRFTLRSLRTLLTVHDFRCLDMTGSVLFCGPFSNLLFSGFRPIMALNNRLGDICPRLASGLFIAGQRMETPT